jgi:long-chain acyl-CoA synthetase
MSSEIVEKTQAAVGQLTGEGAPWELTTQTLAGVEYKAYKDAPGTLVDLFAPAAAHGDKEALVYEDERWTFTQLLQQAASIGHQLLHELKLQRGDRVAIAMRNYPEWLSTFIGITSCGLVAVPLNSWGRKEELEYGLTDSGASVVFCDQQRYAFIASDLDSLGVEAIVARHDQTLSGPRVRSLETFLQGAENAAMPSIDIAPTDPAMIMYTSGTTGLPKGAVSSHLALGQAIFNFEVAAYTAAMVDPEPLTKMMAAGFEQTALLVVPLFHVSGLHSVFLLSLRAGRKIVMMYKWDIEHALQLIERERVTMISAVPTMTLQMMHSPLWDKYDTASLFGIGAGGTASPPALAALIKEKKPDSFPGTGWGLTETNAVGTSFAGAAYLGNSTSAGLPHPISDIRILDDEQNEVPQGDPGHIWIKVITHFTEYWQHPEATAETLHEGWLTSGDIGYFDEDGFLYISDRAKDMIIRGGENIYCAEIEHQALEHPSVMEAAAFGVPHDTLGEELAITLWASPGEHIDIDVMRAYLGEHLAAFKVPSTILVSVESLPKNASGKVLKRQIRQTYLDSQAISS